MESNFGRFTGTRPTVQALATLAWEGRRRAFFTTELINALQILDKGYIELDQMKGSWAGAMGQTQFMPSSYLAHAQDYDGDGRRDIWKTLPDVFASIANYMVAYGWKDDQIWGREVKVPPGGATKLAASVGFRQSGCRAARELTVPIPLAKWQSLGVRTAAGSGAAEGRSRGVAAARRHEVLPGLLELRHAARLQLRARVRARRRPAFRSLGLKSGDGYQQAVRSPQSRPSCRWPRCRWRRACISAAPASCRWR